MTLLNAIKTFRKMCEEELRNFSIDFDFLNNEYFCEVVPDDILLSLEETLCDKIAAVDKENREQKHSMAKPEDCNATSRCNNKTPKKLKADTSKKRFVEVSSTDIDEIIENAESRKTKYQTNGLYQHLMVCIKHSLQSFSLNCNISSATLIIQILTH